MKISSFKIHFLGAIFGRSASVVRPEEEREPMRVFCRHSSILSENDRNNSRKAVHPSDFRGHMLKKSRNADFGDFWSKLKEGSHRLMLISVNLHHNSRAEKHQSIWFSNMDFSYGSLSSSGRTRPHLIGFFFFYVGSSWSKTQNSCFHNRYMKT